VVDLYAATVALFASEFNANRNCIAYKQRRTLIRLMSRGLAASDVFVYQAKTM